VFISIVAFNVRRATRPLGFISFCTWCNKGQDTFRLYNLDMLLHLMDHDSLAMDTDAGVLPAWMKNTQQIMGLPSPPPSQQCVHICDEGSRGARTEQHQACPRAQGKILYRTTLPTCRHPACGHHTCLAACMAECLFACMAEVCSACMARIFHVYRRDRIRVYNWVRFRVYCWATDPVQIQSFPHLCQFTLS